MYTIVSKIPWYKSFYRFGFPALLPLNYTISLTYNCNARCATCKIYKRPHIEELSHHEYKKIFNRLGKSPYWVTFSGGEPSLRSDLVEIVNSCYDICKPHIINIASNGILTTKIVENISAICSHCKNTQIIVNLSIDGIEHQHDEIRGTKDCYKKVINTYRGLQTLKLKNLNVGIHTVVSKYNTKNFAAIANSLLNLNPDQYITEIAEERVELNNVGLDITPDIMHYKAVADFMVHRLKNSKIDRPISRITQAFRIQYYTLVKQILKDEIQPIPCYAGVASCQISPDGELWLCCTKAESMGNLRDCGYDIRKLWNTPLIKKKRQDIKNKKCHCPLANVGYTNMLMDMKILFQVFIRSVLKPLVSKEQVPKTRKMASDNSRLKP